MPAGEFRCPGESNLGRMTFARQRQFFGQPPQGTFLSTDFNRLSLPCRRMARNAGLDRAESRLTPTWTDQRMATDELKTEGEPTKPYVLYRVGGNERIMERIVDGHSVEDLFKEHRRRLNWKYAVYHHGKRIFLPRWG
jgi:hypothetical protein